MRSDTYSEFRWPIVFLPQVSDWLEQLEEGDQKKVSEALDQLGSLGPQLGRPFADHVKKSQFHKLKELRPLASSIRILFIFDEERQAVLLCAGDKRGNWQGWYKINIAIAEDRYRRYLNDIS